MVFSFAILAISTHAQDNYQLGAIPSFNLTKNFYRLYKLNVKSEFRQVFQEGALTDRNTFEYHYLHSDLALVVIRKLGTESSIGGGYLIRIKEGGNSHRLIQQYIVTKRYSIVKLSHRFRTDQTFNADDPTSFRFRYRLASAIPLIGLRADPGELYLKINNEYLLEFEDQYANPEIRAIGLLGFKINNFRKVEIGLDYRVKFENPNIGHRFWLAMNIYQTFR